MLSSSFVVVVVVENLDSWWRFLCVKTSQKQIMRIKKKFLKSPTSTLTEHTVPIAIPGFNTSILSPKMNPAVQSVSVVNNSLSTFPSLSNQAWMNEPLERFMAVENDCSILQKSEKNYIPHPLKSEPIY